jgi:hypothetical protein
MPFIPPIIGDPNSVEPHTDIIRDKLLAAVEDETLPELQRVQAKKTLEQCTRLGRMKPHGPI